jgi:hypothetical protein
MASSKILTRNAIARLAKIEKKILKAGEASTQDMVTAGKEFARARSPKFTGFVYRSIKGKVRTTNKGSEGLIFIDPVITPGSQRMYGSGTVGSFSLVKWMHQTGGVFRHDNPFGKAGKQHIPRANATFMYDAREYLQGAGLGMTQKRFDKILIK